MGDNEQIEQAVDNGPRDNRKEVRVIGSWEDVDAALGALRRVEHDLAEVQADLGRKITELQQELAERTQPLQRRRDRIEERIAEYCEAHRAELPDGARSQKLTHGTIGWRKGNLTVEFSSSEDDSLRMLKVRGHTECIKVKESLDKRLLTDLPAGEATLCGITLTQTDRFYVKLVEEPLAEYPETPETAEPTKGTEA